MKDIANVKVGNMNTYNVKILRNSWYVHLLFI